MKKYPPTRDRRDVGQVISPIEKMMAAREASSCCVGVEALLEIDSKQIIVKGFGAGAAKAAFRERD